MKTIMKYALVVMSCSCLISCADLWKDKANNEWSEKYVWSVAEMAEGVLFNAYKALPHRPDSYSNNFLDAATDNATAGSMNSVMYNLASGNISVKNNPIANWNECYRQLQYINSFLENGLSDDILYDKESPEINKAYKKKLYGEAHFLRAWYMFELLRIYGGRTESGKAMGVPVADHFFTNEEAADFSKTNRASYEDCILQILKDCDTAVENLPDAYYNGADKVTGDINVGMATSIAAMALKTRVALYAASPAFRDAEVVDIKGLGDFSIVDPEAYLKNWERAALLADKVIATPAFGAGIYGLKATDLADPEDASVTPKEFLLRTYHNSNDIEARHYPPYYWGNAQAQPVQNLVNAFPMANGFPIDDARSQYDPDNPYRGRDARFYLNIYYQGALFCENGHPIDVSEGGRDSYSYNRFGSATGYYLAKFVSRKNSDMLDPFKTSSAYHFNPLLRRTEVFLNYAEAANEAWGPYGNPKGCRYTAYDVIRELREVSGGIKDTEYLDKVAAEGKDAFRQLIQNERRIELAFENHRYFDMRRCLMDISQPVYGVTVTGNGSGYDYDFTHKVADRAFNDIKYYYLPLPYDECIKNPEMENNFGWN